MHEKQRQAGLARIPQARAFLQVSRSKLYLMMDRGELEFVKFGRSRRIAWAELYDFVSRMTQTGDGTPTGDS